MPDKKRLLGQFSYMHSVDKNNFIGKTFYAVIDSKKYSDSKSTDMIIELKYKSIINESFMGYCFCDIENVASWHKIFPNGLIYNVTIPPNTQVFKYTDKYITDHMIITDPKRYDD